jgi:hypothetical protein
MRISILFALPFCCLPGFTLPRSAASQAVRIGRHDVTPQIAVLSLQVTASPSSVSFPLKSKGVAAGSSPIVITTTPGTCAISCTIKLYGYFTSATAALSGGSPSVQIPSSAVLGKVATGTPTSYTPFAQSAPLGGAGASLLLFTQSGGINLGGKSRTDSLSLNIDLTNQPQLPAGTYSGTLNIQAQSF